MRRPPPRTARPATALPRLARWLLLPTLALAACDLPSFDPITLLAAPRVLAVRATPPWAAPGEVVTLEALDHPAGSLALTWAACLLPPVPGGDDVNLACVTTEAGPDLVPLGQGDRVGFVLPTLPPALAAVVDDRGLPSLPVRVRSTPPTGGPTRTDVLRLRTVALGATTPRNQDPRLLAVRYADDAATLDESASPCDDDRQELAFGAPLDDQASVSLAAEASIALAVVLAPGSAEPLPGAGSAPPCEALEIRWYASAGTLLHEATGPHQLQRLSLPGEHAPAPGSTVDLLAVVRDGRGGVDWLLSRLLVAP